jgi:hypothetical protein
MDFEHACHPEWARYPERSEGSCLAAFERWECRSLAALGMTGSLGMTASRRPAINP